MKSKRKLMTFVYLWIEIIEEQIQGKESGGSWIVNEDDSDFTKRLEI